MAELDRLLSRSFTDFVITDGEANRALQVLEEVRPQDFKKVLSQMESSGTLNKFFAEAPASTRDGMLYLMASHGMLQREVGRQVDGKFDPPSHPETFVWDKRLPDPVLQAIRSNTHEAWNNYESRFEEYLDRYGSAVQQSGTPAELRRLGPPANPVSAPGRHLSNSVALQTLTDKIYEFRGEQRGALGSLKGVLEAKLFGNMVTGEVVLNRNGLRASTERALESNLEKKLGKGLVGEVKLAATEQGLVEGGVAIKEKLTNLGAELTVRSDLSAELEISMGVASVRTNVVPKKAALSAGVCLTPRKESAELKVCAEVEGVGISPKVASLGFSNRESFFEQPSELLAGKAWAALSGPRRDQVEYRCWTEKEWNEALANRGN
ncbi:MAG: hypothetical protein M3Y59_19955 [Myxococcota bacterium]|nr:hypothetical protein [Myxococcota bacterium]